MDSSEQRNKKSAYCSALANHITSQLNGGSKAELIIAQSKKSEESVSTAEYSTGDVSTNSLQVLSEDNSDFSVNTESESETASDVFSSEETGRYIRTMLARILED